MSMFGHPKADGAKPLASLSATLLARKGHAKPAMRPQGYGGFGAVTGGHDDLGWNDMGADLGDTASCEPPVPAVPVPVVPVPAVLVQREVLAEELAAPLTVPIVEPVVEIETAPRPALKPVSVATATRLGRETARKIGKGHRKAAFTLRLDHDRHLRLRIASALHNASAQTLVTEALDQFLQSLPEVEALVAHIPQRAKG